MIVPIPNVLDTEALQSILSSLQTAKFVDGKITAGWYTKDLKHNQQAESNALGIGNLRKQVKQALSNNLLFQLAVRPKVVHSILFSRYDQGMSYGRHIDNPVMTQQKWRSDVSFTIFLNPPNEYEGGELVLEGLVNEQKYKLAAGSAILYPSFALHRVNPITRGTRWVAVGWVQSMVRDPIRREILFDLHTAHRSLFTQIGQRGELDLIAKSAANLLRLWAE